MKRESHPKRQNRNDDIFNRYHIHDSRNIHTLLPGKPVIDVTITSPPYWNLKDYGNDSQIGFGQTYEEYLDDLQKVFSSVYRGTKKNGSLWIISDSFKYDGEMRLLPFDLANRLKKAGWILQDVIIWNKDKTLPWSHRGKLRNIFEYIAFYTKEHRFKYRLERVREVDKLQEWWVRYPERYSPNGKAPSRLWYYAIPRQGSWGNNWVRHFNPLPPNLIERILLLTTDENDIVLDPFAGSGIVLAQAEAMDRMFIGIDLNKKYQKMFYNKVRPAIITLKRQGKESAANVLRAKKRFFSLIRSLRLLKFPKELVRLYKISFGQVDIECIYVIKSSKRPAVTLYFQFLNKATIPQGFIRQANDLIRKAPLSKYGMAPELKKIGANSISLAWFARKGIQPNQKLYAYKAGRTYSFYRLFEAKNAIAETRFINKQESKNKQYPLIISNVRVAVSPKNHSLIL